MNNHNLKEIENDLKEHSDSYNKSKSSFLKELEEISEALPALRTLARLHLSCNPKIRTLTPNQMLSEENNKILNMLYAASFGFGAIEGLTGDVVQSIGGEKRSLSSNARMALVYKAGHKVSLEESTEERCTVKGERKDNGATATVTFTMKDAERAQLNRSPSWNKYPKDMLRHRAQSILCRTLFPDIMNGDYYTPEEAASFTKGISGEQYEEIVSSEIRRSPSPQKTVVRTENPQSTPVTIEDSHAIRCIEEMESKYFG